MKNSKTKQLLFQFFYTKPSFDKKVLTVKKSLDQVKKLLDGKEEGKGKGEKKE